MVRFDVCYISAAFSIPFYRTNVDSLKVLSGELRPLEDALCSASYRRNLATGLLYKVNTHLIQLEKQPTANVINLGGAFDTLMHLNPGETIKTGMRKLMK